MSIGLSNTIIQQARTVLGECLSLQTQASMRLLFRDKRIILWRDIVPDTTNLETRVDFLIDDLLGRANEEGQNALVLFLLVVSDNEETTRQKQAVRQLARLVAQDLQLPDPLPPEPIVEPEPVESESEDDTQLKTPSNKSIWEKLRDWWAAAPVTLRWLPIGIGLLVLLMWLVPRLPKPFDVTIPDPTTTITSPPVATLTVTLTPTNTPNPTETPTLAPTPTATPIPGIWNGLWSSSCSFIDCQRLNLTQTGDNVSGSYASGDGSITGTVKGNWLTGQWFLGGTNGTFDFWLSDDGSYWQGNWDRTFAWCGYRVGGAPPNPCGIARWYGIWQTSYGALNIIQLGPEIKGTYADNSGRIEGLAFGISLTGSWQRGEDSSGSLAFFQNPNGRQFNGYWNDTKAWCGAREGESLPIPCYNTDDQVFKLPSLSIFNLPEFLIATPPATIPDLNIFANPNLDLMPFVQPTSTP